MKLLSCETAEAALVGHVIILGITILGVSMIALYGVPAILSLQDMANAKNAEQTFAVLDSHASRAILGDSPLQITNVNLGGGTLTVEPNSTNSPSYIVINSTIFNFSIPMGKVKYQLGDRIVAYEGGGVWSKYPSGSVMLSRPEFNYNGVTLTLPVFDLSGNSSVGGKGTAVVSFTKNPAVVLFPNPSLGINRTNPVNYSSIGKVYVNITSDFYDAWADYVSMLSSSKIVSEDPKNRSISIALTVYPAYVGIMNYTSIADPIVFRGLDPSNSTPLNNFSFRIYSSDISKINWDIRAKSGNKRLIYHITATNTYATINAGYEDDGKGYDDPAETWKGSNNLFPVQGTSPNQYVDVDLLNTSINLTYGSVTVGTDSSCSNKINSGDFNTSGFSWGIPLTKDVTQKSLYNITQHYIQLMAQEGDISFSQCSPSSGGNHGPSTTSTMSIDYIAPGGLTYLHITDNKADVGIS